MKTTDWRKKLEVRHRSTREDAERAVRESLERNLDIVRRDHACSVEEWLERKRQEFLSKGKRLV
ncbi:MAG: hypothetical protein RE468_04945 [Acidithiobacillus caldus]|uniref:hypothetical protein n=1 Tax=Acidithiobacillus caldus TaxID=33059 RepID=UPI002814F1A4|nr:hypothetical protein [Acidithiobacillus caldus]WMT47960.1 MAG: hypothetical protein RE468_04945 [Acidithiobacillus caldus]